MKPGKIFFIISLLGILSLIFIAQIGNSKTGTIKSIKYSENKITIELENSEETLIVFESERFNLEKGDKISFQGRSEVYKGEKQIIVDRILKEND